MSDVINLFDKKKEIEDNKPRPTVFTHDIEGNLLPSGSMSIAARTEENPLNDGYHIKCKCVCMLCDAEHDAIAPQGAWPLQCPSCIHYYMIPHQAPAPKVAWTCLCGSHTWYLTKTHPMCTQCGSFTTGWANS